MPIFEEGWRFCRGDLSAVTGVGSSVLGTLMSELGTGSQIKSAFRSAEAFASWLGLCPDNRVSGGRVLKAKTRKVVSRVAAALRLAAQSLRNREPPARRGLSPDESPLGQSRRPHRHRA